MLPNMWTETDLLLVQLEHCNSRVIFADQKILFHANLRSDKNPTKKNSLNHNLNRNPYFFINPIPPESNQFNPSRNRS